jgi:hypothetical protein
MFFSTTTTTTTTTNGSFNWIVPSFGVQTDTDGDAIMGDPEPFDTQDDIAMEDVEMEDVEMEDTDIDTDIDTDMQDIDIDIVIKEPEDRSLPYFCFWSVCS